MKLSVVADAPAVVVNVAADVVEPGADDAGVPVELDDCRWPRPRESVRRWARWCVALVLVVVVVVTVGVVVVDGTVVVVIDGTVVVAVDDDRAVVVVDDVEVVVVDGTVVMAVDDTVVVDDEPGSGRPASATVLEAVGAVALAPSAVGTPGHAIDATTATRPARSAMRLRPRRPDDEG